MQTREKRGKTHSAKGAEDDHAPSMAAAMQTDRLLCKSGLLSYSEGANSKALGDTGLVKQLHPTLPLDFQKRGEWRHKRTGLWVRGAGNRRAKTFNNDLGFTSEQSVL